MKELLKTKNNEYIFSNFRENAEVCCQDIITSFQEEKRKNKYEVYIFLI